MDLTYLFDLEDAIYVNTTDGIISAVVKQIDISITMNSDVELVNDIKYWVKYTNVDEETNHLHAEEDCYASLAAALNALYGVSV